MPGLQVFYDPIGCTQGAAFTIQNAVDNNDGTITLTLNWVLTEGSGILPADGTLMISRFIPLALSIKRYTPTNDIYYEDTIVNDFSFEPGNWISIYPLADQIIEGFTGSTVVTINILKEQVIQQASGAFPLDSLPESLTDCLISFPWLPTDFNYTLSATAPYTTFTTLPQTGPITLNYSYLYDKASTHFFAVKQKPVGGGTKTTEIEIKDDKPGEKGITNKIPFATFEKGDVQGHYNTIAAQGILTGAPIPALGGEFIAYSAFPSQFGIPIDEGAFSKSDINEPKKYTIGLNHRLVSYSTNERRPLGGKDSHKIPLSAFDIKLIKVLGENRSEEDDPIIDAIKRGLKPESLSPETFKLYKKYFTKNIIDPEKKDSKKEK